MMKTDLNDFLKPGRPLPPDSMMVEKALEVLQLCPHGQQLANFVEKKELQIKIIATPQPLSYLPEKKLVYIGFNRNNPGSPTRFILMLTGVLREAQQEAAGIKHPPLNAPKEEHMKVSMAKEEDKLWYICTVAAELEALEMFKEFRFLDELRKMGHNEILELFLKQKASDTGSGL